MGVAIENANAITKVFTEQSVNIAAVMKDNSFRVSQVDGMQYSLSYLVATSMGGGKTSETGSEPIDITVSMNIDLKEFPKIKAKPIEHEDAEHEITKPTVTPVKFSTTRDKFLQFSKDMRGALALLEDAQKQMSEL